MRKVPAEDNLPWYKGFAEGSCGRFLRKVPRKVFLRPLLKVIIFYGGGLRGRFLRKAPRKVFAEGSAEDSPRKDTKVDSEMHTHQYSTTNKFTRAKHAMTS